MKCNDIKVGQIVTGRVEKYFKPTGHNAEVQLIKIAKPVKLAKVYRNTLDYIMDSKNNSDTKFYIYKILTPEFLSEYTHIVFGGMRIYGDDMGGLDSYIKGEDGYPLFALEWPIDPTLKHPDIKHNPNFDESKAPWNVGIIIKKDTPLIDFFRKFSGNDLGLFSRFFIDQDGDFINLVSFGAYDGDTGGAYDYNAILNIAGDEDEFGGDFDEDYEDESGGDFDEDYDDDSGW